MTINSDCDYALQSELSSTFLTWASRASFFIFSPVSTILSMLLIIGYLKFKTLRDRPGDIILALAINNAVLTFYWTLTTAVPSLKQGWFCQLGGTIDIFAEYLNYAYNVAFVFYLNQKLKNLLKQARITRAAATHVVCLFGCFSFTVYSIVSHKEIGPNSLGICTLRYSCHPSVITGAILLFFFLAFEAFAIYVYLFIKKSFAQVLASSNGAERFLDNYRGLILITSTFWFGLAVALTFPFFTNFQHTFTGDVLNVLGNFCLLFQSMSLAVYRLRDSLVRREMKRLIFFWNNEEPKTPLLDRSAFIASDTTSDQSVSGLFDDLGINGPLLDTEENFLQNLDEANFLEFFSVKRKLDLTYSILSSILVAYSDSESPVKAYSRKFGFNDSVAFEVNEKIVFAKVPKAKSECETLKSQIFPTKLTAYGLQNSLKLIHENIGIESLKNSLDLQNNRKKILQDNAGNGGKSGEFFFFSTDNKLIIKTISNEELKTLMQILPAYHQHLKDHPNSLIIHIYGVFRLEWEYKPINLIVMANISPFPDNFIEARFDLKGSTYTRQVLKDYQYDDRKLIKSRTLKDLDFLFLEKEIKVANETRIEILETIREDLEFLSRYEFMDYSLILFVVNKKKMDFYILNDEENPNTGVVEEKWPSLIPIETQPGFCYSLGIVDFLQKYTLKKKMEKRVKKIINFDQNLDTSSQDPIYYKERFWDFMNQLLAVKDEQTL